MIVLVFTRMPSGLAIAAFLITQMLAALDVILLIAGRFSPRITLLGIQAQEWLGPLPWRRHD